VKTFHLHLDLLVAESEKFSRQLNGSFKEASEGAIKLDEDSELFGFFLDYMYRDRSILSRDISHTSEYVTLARLYAMSERLAAPRLQASCLWRFTQFPAHNTVISDEATCELLQIACTEITERVSEDPMRAHIFWYAGYKISSLQKSGMFRQLLCDVPEVARQVCLMVTQGQPPKSAMPNELSFKRFSPESEHTMRETMYATPAAVE
jgi:hypothetical protein